MNPLTVPALLHKKHEARDYGVARYGMETMRLCSTLNNGLAGKTYLVGEEVCNVSCHAR